MEKGIYLVNLDEKIDMDNLKKAGGNVEAFVTTDNVAVGAKGAEFIIDKLGAEGGEVAIIEGKAGNASGEARRNGATDAFKRPRRSSSSPVNLPTGIVSKRWTLPLMCCSVTQISKQFIAPTILWQWASPRLSQMRAKWGKFWW